MKLLGNKSHHPHAATAVEEMLSVEELQIKGIREALEEADSGNLIAHEDIKLEWETRRAGQVVK